MHNRKLNRLQGYDYSRNALYFVTSCVQDRICWFGEIWDQQMLLNEYGKIAEQQWYWLAQQYPYVILHQFVVMPNHIHGIIEIDDSIVDSVVGTGRDLSHLNDDNAIGTGRDLSLRPQSPLQPEKIKIKSLSELMGAYKTTTSKQIHCAGLVNFKWQRSFHDHIIRNQASFIRISDYIQNNPANWKEDTFFTKR